MAIKKKSYLALTNIMVILTIIFMVSYMLMDLENRFLAEHTRNVFVVQDKLTNVTDILEISGEHANKIINHENLTELFEISEYRELIQYLEYDETTDTFNLDRLVDTDLNLYEISNITGKGNLDFLEDKESVKTKEIYQTFLMNDMYYILNDKIEASYWVYYTSLNGFTSIRKQDDYYVTSDELSYDDVFLSMPYMKSGNVENNPNRKSVVWSDPYLDYADGGLMVTATYPVDYQGEYLGTIAVDFIASQIRPKLSDRYITYLLDEQGRVITTNNKDINLIDEVNNFDDISKNIKFQNLKKLNHDTVEYIDGVKVIAHKIKETPYTIYQIYYLDNYIKDAFVYSLPLVITIILFIIVNIMLNIYIRTRESEKKLKNEQRELDYLASYDVLTDIYNRRGLYSEIEKMDIAVINSSALVMLDIDRFKVINDNYGHDVGDIVLSELSKVIKTCVRDTDVFARFGGEEFLILLKNCNIDEAVKIAEKIRYTVEKHTFEHIGNLTISLGVSECINEDFKQKTFKNADNCLYKAKESGRNLVCYLEDGEIKKYNK